MANRVTIVMNADGSAYIEGIDQVNSATRKLEADTKSLTDKIKAHWLSVAAAIYSLKKAWNFAEEAARVDQLKQSFVNLAASHGVNAERLIEDLKRVSAHTVTTAELMRAAGTAMVLGIPADKLAEMMEIARASSKITGQTIQKSFEDIGLGVARQSRLILDNLGIIIKEEEAQRKYAASIHKTASQLTEAEKKQAFMNAAMAAGLDTVKRVGSQTLTAAEAMAKFKTVIYEASVFIGKVLITAVSGASTLLMGLSEIFWTLAGDIAYALYRIAELGSKLPFVGEQFKGLASELQYFSDMSYSAADQAREMGISAANVAESIWKEKVATVGLTTSINDNTDSIQANIEQKQKLLEAEQKLREAGSTAAIEDVKRTAGMELKELERAYQKKTIQAEEYFAKKREIENRSYQAMLSQVLEEIAAEESMAKAKMEALAGQPAEVLRTAELEHASKLIELADRYRSIKSEQEQAELDNIYALIDANAQLAQERFAAEMELVRLAQENPYKNNLENYQGDNEVAQDYAKYQEKLYALQGYNTQVIQEMVNAGASQDQIAKTYSNLEIEYSKKKKDFQITYAADAAGSMSNIMQNLYAATGSKNKAMFEAMKAFAIAETVIKTYQGAQEAYTALAGIPIIGPALGVAAAAAAIAAGMARIQAIRSQQPGGSTGISAGGNAMPSYSGGSPDAYPVPQRIEKQERPLSISLHISGDVHSDDVDKLARKLVAPLQKAMKDGVH